MIDPVFERRSIRRYKDDAVPKEMIEEIIKQAFQLRLRKTVSRGSL